MRKSLALLIVVLSVALSGCVSSVFPLYTDKDLRTDATLVGTWKEKDDGDESWTFTKRDESSYTLVVKEGQKSSPFEARLVQLGKYRFLDIAADGDGLDNADLIDLYKMTLIPGHLFIKVTAIEPVLRMALLDHKWMRQYLEAHPGELAHRLDGGDGIVLVAPTRDLQSFLLRHAENKDAFGESSELKKIK
jgi:hypothetical protein